MSEEDGGRDDLKMPKHFDVVILDLEMPIMGGIEACQQIKQIYHEFNQNKLSQSESCRNCSQGGPQNHSSDAHHVKCSSSSS